MEKAIEIKRRAQRCVQNGDVDGALREYEKLVQTPESDPYNFVLLADLLYKKGDQPRAAERYLNAVTAYQQAGLFKNAIAVCKKMSRLSLSPTLVLRNLADLHALDGLASEASMYYAQYAEQMLRANNIPEAITSLRKAFDSGQENVRLLEQLSEVLLLEGQQAKSAEAMREAAGHWETRGHPADARRCLARANLIHPASAKSDPDPSTTGAPTRAPAEAAQPSAPKLSSPASPAAAGAVPPAEPPGVLTGSRIPGVTAPSLEPEEPAAEPLEVEPLQEFHAGPAEPVRAPDPRRAPPADSGTFERARAFRPPSAPAAPRAAPPAAPVHDPPGRAEEEAITAEGVYEIGGEAEAGYESALEEAERAPRAARNGPLPGDDPADDLTPSVIARRPTDVGDVEELLQRAQEEFRAGRRDHASQALVEAALAYERLSRLESAATIFRSLGRGTSAPAGVLELWLANCERRGDHQEGSQVACELGDRALNEGHENQALRWFEHALGIDPENDTARRRLQRFTNRATNRDPSSTGAPPAAPGTSEAGRVAVAVGRGQAITFDLQGLLQEFQRGVESQLEGDAQGNYDLGMAYREMGLLTEAVAAFRVAERDPRLTLRAREMSGRCLADAGRHDDALREFEGALRFHTLDATAEAELRYQLALSLAACGELADAVAQLEIADMRSPGRPDIVARLAEWRRAFGQAA